MASWMLDKASARVLPWEMQPGRDGTSATTTPSSSCSISTRYFIHPSCQALAILRRLPRIDACRTHVA